MKIGHPADKPVAATPAAGHASTPEPAKAGTAAVPAGTVAPVAPDASANVKLSTAASNLLSSGSSAEFDADKVARISQSMAAGTFKINPGVIADKLISNAQELLTKVKH